MNRNRIHIIAPLAVAALVLIAAGSPSAQEPVSQEEALQQANREMAKELFRLRAELEAARAALKKAQRPLFSMYDFLPALAAEGKDVPERVAKQLKEGKVTTTGEARGVALKHYMKERGGFGANQSIRAASLFPLAASIEDFADSGDLIWEIRIEGVLGTNGVHQIILINARTGAVRSMLPPFDENRPERLKIEAP